MPWRCRECEAVISDDETKCPFCVDVTKGTDTVSSVDDTAKEEVKVETKRDAEGLSVADRMRRRPRREVAGSFPVRKPRRTKKRNQFTDAVVPGSVRATRPIFKSLIK